MATIETGVCLGTLCVYACTYDCTVFLLSLSVCVHVSVVLLVFVRMCTVYYYVYVCMCMVAFFYIIMCNVTVAMYVHTLFASSVILSLPHSVPATNAWSMSCAPCQQMSARRLSSL